MKSPQKSAEPAKSQSQNKAKGNAKQKTVSSKTGNQNWSKGQETGTKGNQNWDDKREKKPNVKVEAGHKAKKA